MLILRVATIWFHPSHSVNSKRLNVATGFENWSNYLPSSPRFHLTNDGSSPSYFIAILLYVCSCVLGGIIALGVFGGFVFLAAIITTIVILIRR